MNNRKLSEIFFEMAEILSMQEVPFRPRAFEKVASTLEDLEEDVADIYKRAGIAGLERIPGVGKGIAERIEEYLKTGRIKDYDALKKKMPVDVRGLTSIEGVGPKTIKVLYQKLKIKNVRELERAARRGLLRDLPRLGQKFEEKILKSIAFRKKSGGRFLLGEVRPLAEGIKKRLLAFRGVEKVEFAGSLRRMQETVGDLDMLAVSDRPVEVMDLFVGMPEVVHVYAKGKTKSMVRLNSGIDADLRVIPKESFGAALQYFTGNKDHNVALRKIAIKRGFKLNEYGLWHGPRQVAGKDEEEIYKKLGLDWMAPEIRLNSGEIEAAAKHKLPKLVGYSDLCGDLQTQTDWTDGADSIENMSEEAERLGLEYILITDHTKSLAMTHGSDEKKLLRQIKAIALLNKKLRKRGKKIRVLSGAEVNILKDGSLDIEDRVLSALDVVGAAVHSHFHLAEAEQTARVIRAMENPYVDIIFHPTGRIINEREAIALNLDKIFAAARHTGTVLEIDAYPSRLDLKCENIRRARESGIKFSVSSDAHATAHMRFLEYGLGQARAAWCEKGDIINTMPLKQFLELMKKPKNKRFRR